MTIYRGHLLHVTGSATLEDAAEALVSEPDGALAVGPDGRILLLRRLGRPARLARRRRGRGHRRLPAAGLRRHPRALSADSHDRRVRRRRAARVARAVRLPRGVPPRRSGVRGCRGCGVRATADRGGHHVRSRLRLGLPRRAGRAVHSHARRRSAHRQRSRHPDRRPGQRRGPADERGRRDRAGRATRSPAGTAGMPVARPPMRVRRSRRSPSCRGSASRSPPRPSGVSASCTRSAQARRRLLPLAPQRERPAGRRRDRRGARPVRGGDVPRHVRRAHPARVRRPAARACSAGAASWPMPCTAPTASCTGSPRPAPRSRTARRRSSSSGAARCRGGARSRRESTSRSAPTSAPATSGSSRACSTTATRCT